MPLPASISLSGFPKNRLFIPQMGIHLGYLFLLAEQEGHFLGQSRLALLERVAQACALT